MPQTPLLTIYKSSAGSGKTFTLVKEYLKIVIANPVDFKRILAITFTNKATEEMKTRVIRKLVDIADGKDTTYVNEHLGLPLSASEASQSAHHALTYILHDYSSFMIATIDSFFSAVVRSLARELNLPIRFDMELSTDQVIRDITFELFEDLEDNKTLQDWMGAYIEDLLEQDKSWKIEQSVHETAKELFSDTFRMHHGKSGFSPKQSFIQSLKNITDKFHKDLADYSKQYQDIFDAYALEVEDFSYGKTGAANIVNKLLNAPNKLPEFGTRFLKAMEDPKGWYSKSSPHAVMIHAIATESLIPLSKELYAYFEVYLPSYLGAKHILKVIYLSGLLTSLNEKLIKYRTETDTILLSDVNHLLAAAIGSNDAPFIYEKLGNRFKHFMLDEFQDTSVSQWKNLLPLVVNGLASGNTSLVVGDSKQSIYRWRGGDLHLLEQQVGRDLHQFMNENSEQVLGTNYRSFEHIIQFNNRFFPAAANILSAGEDALPSDLINRIYDAEQVVQKVSSGNEGKGYVEVRGYLVTKSKKKSQESDDDDEDGDNSWRTRSLEQMSSKIAELLSQGHSAGDIVILLRKNIEAPAVAEALIAKGIHNIISPDSLYLTGSDKIRFLISILKMLAFPEDKIALAHAVKFLDNNKTALNDLVSLSTSELRKKLPSAFLTAQRSLAALSLYECVENITNIFNISSQPDAYLQRFYDLILEYAVKSPSGIDAFLEWWEEHKHTDKCSVILPQSDDAIRIMTVHKSKGLEFKIVFMPFCDWKFAPNYKSTTWVQSNVPPFSEFESHLVHPVSELKNSVFKTDILNEFEASTIENLNMLYVAFTRPVAMLFVNTKFNKSFKSDKNAISNCGVLLQLFLEQPEHFMNRNMEEEEVSYTYGTPYQASGRQAVASVVTQPAQWHSTPWKEKLWLAINKNKIALNDPVVADTSYGNTFHTIMSAVDTLTENALPELLSAVKEKYPEMSEKLIPDLQFVLESGNALGWFSEEAEILCEEDILDTSGNLYRPDRLIIDQEKNVQVIDYKTGTEDPKHKEQVAHYAQLLTQMGYKAKGIYLVYPALRKVETVEG